MSGISQTPRYQLRVKNLGLDTRFFSFFFPLNFANVNFSILPEYSVRQSIAIVFFEVSNFPLLERIIIRDSYV